MIHLLLASIVAGSADLPPISPPAGSRLAVVGRHETGTWNGSAAEISAFHPATHRLFVVDAKRGLRALDLHDPAHPRECAMVAREGLNSVAVHGDLVAIVRQPADRRQRGTLELLSPGGESISRIEVGFGPDMVTFTPDGTRVLVANEGERSDDGAFDPEGSIGIVDLARGPTQPAYRELGLGQFQPQREALERAGLHCVSPNATLAQDLEPEYITVSPDGRRAFVTLQENNAIAVVGMEPGKERVERIDPLGFKDFSVCGLDASDRDGGAHILPAPVLGLCQPDTIKCFEHGGSLWLVTANEGEDRTAPDAQEAVRLATLKTRLPTELMQDARLGRLQVSRLRGDDDHDGTFERLFCFGGRGISIWKVADDGSIVQAWDSGSEFERMMAARMPEAFNMDSDKGASMDARSPKKGCEPEGLDICAVGERRVVFVGLERAGGVMAWDISDPTHPAFLDWLNPRDPAVKAGPKAGDVAPEGVLAIPASLSPTGEPLIAVCNEVSGTTTLMRLAPSTP